MADRESNPVQLAALAEAIAATAETLRQSTVQVRTERRGSGSGVIWRRDGVIMTNAHVVREAKATVELVDGRILAAQVTARNRQRDLVALRVDAVDLPAVAIAHSETLRVGELVLAVGTPWGIPGTLTTGIIHTMGVNRTPHWIQADIDLAPGNSGGPLANAQGAVIGINTMIVNGRGFAIPSHVVEQFLNHRGEPPYLGVTLQPVRLWVERKRAIGLLINAIAPGSPAAIASLLPGDVLMGVRGRAFQTVDELANILANSQDGDGLLLDVMRGDQQITVDVVLCSRDSQVQAA